MTTYLANENLPIEAIQAARKAGIDINWIAELAPGASDEIVLAMASAEHHILLTCDKDFGEMVFRQGMSATCGVILFRPKIRSAQHLAQFVVSVLSQDLSWEGRFAVAQEGQIRIIELPK